MSHGTLSRAAWPLALALVALVALLIGRPAGAQQARGGKWDYRVFTLNPADYNDTADYKEILEQNGNDPVRAEAPFQEHVLKYLGDDGWELVLLERPRPNLVHFVLKRPAR